MGLGAQVRNRLAVLRDPAGPCVLGRDETNGFFTADFKKALRVITDLFKREQHHFEQSPYRFTRNNGIPEDSIRNGGLGM